MGGTTAWPRPDGRRTPGTGSCGSSACLPEQSPTTPATSARGGSVRCRWCAIDGTDYSVPRDGSAIARCWSACYVHEVVISCACIAPGSLDTSLSHAKSGLSDAGGVPRLTSLSGAQVAVLLHDPLGIVLFDEPADGVPQLRDVAVDAAMDDLSLERAIEPLGDARWSGAVRRRRRNGWMPQNLIWAW